MTLKTAICLLILSLPITTSLKAQMKEGYKAEIEIQAIGTTNGTVPFWMRSNQFGSVPLNGISGSVIGRLSKDYDELSTSDKLYGRSRVFDWGFGIEGRANGGKNSNLQLIEGYLKAKASIFQLKVGRSRDVMGLTGDTSGTLGSFAISGNALGIPKLEISVPEYSLPIFNGLFSFKGNFVHGWLGKTRILTPSNPDVDPASYNTFPISYFHQKSLYVKMGKPEWKLKLFGGFNHQVYWDNQKAAYGSKFNLSTVETFLYVVTGKPYGAPGVPNSKIGNQLGSVDLAIEYTFSKLKFMIYRQNFYDVGALAKLANIKDGLNGITISNIDFESNSDRFRWKKTTFEFFYSKDQAGYPSSTKTKSGDEDYYNNYYYKDGWSYKGLGLGTPIITRVKDAKKGQASSLTGFDYFINNRVSAIHLSTEGTYNGIEFLTKITYSRNYGTFGTSIYGKSTGSIRYPNTTNIFQTVTQTSFLLDVNKTLKNGYKIGGVFAADQGRLLNNSLGIEVKVIRQF